MDSEQLQELPALLRGLLCSFHTVTSPVLRGICPWPRPVPQVPVWGALSQRYSREGPAHGRLLPTQCGLYGASSNSKPSSASASSHL